jgi:hypothetical protein
MNDYLHDEELSCDDCSDKPPVMGVIILLCLGMLIVICLALYVFVVVL